MIAAPSPNHDDIAPQVIQEVPEILDDLLRREVPAGLGREVEPLSVVCRRDADADDDRDIIASDLVVGSGNGAGSRVTAYLGKNIAPAGTPPTSMDFDSMDNFTGGVFVG